MATILFFDDWLIQNKRGMSRRWFRAEPWPGLEVLADPVLKRSFHHCSIIRDGDRKGWRMWCYGQSASGEAAQCLYESADGLAWRPCDFNPPVDGRVGSVIRNAIFSGNTQVGGGCVVRDDHDPSPARRYKMVYVDSLPGKGSESNRGQIAVSSDGIHWKAEPGVAWSDEHVDTFHSTQFNPYTQQWQWMSRPISGDRRVAIYQTSDFKNFSGPQVVMHPDPLDSPCVEFYGMPHFFYEGYGIGFLWRMHTSFDEVGLPHRSLGMVDSELTYSVNGLAWNRTNRQCITPDYGFGPKSIRSIYPECMVVDDEGWMRIYASAYLGEHKDNKRYEPEEKIGGMAISRLRRDGFCAMQTDSDIGYMTLRPLISRGGQIRLNAVTGRFGYIRAELRTVPDNKAIPGYELEHCLPIEGDGHFLTLRWKDRQTIDAFDGQPFRIHLKMDRARLYAIRVEADYLCESHIHLNLAGQTMAGANPDFYRLERMDAYPPPVV